MLESSAGCFFLFLFFDYKLESTHILNVRVNFVDMFGPMQLN